MKTNRVLEIYLKLLGEEKVNLIDLSNEYEVDKRTIQRDIEDLRSFVSLKNIDSSIEYNKKQKSYILKNVDNDKLSNAEILAVCKILIDSRAFLKKEMEEIINKLIKQCVPKANFKKVNELVLNEKINYLELNHKKSVFGNIWLIGEASSSYQKIEIEYMKNDKRLVKRILSPVGLMFSEYYFYLLGFIDDIDKEKYFENKDDIFPTIYRVDRIKKIKILDEKFKVPYSDRFQEGEFRKRIHFMTGGRLQKIKFEYYGTSLEAVLDKIPTAKVEKSLEKGYLISAEVFGDGIYKWIKSHGDDIKILQKIEIK